MVASFFFIRLLILYLYILYLHLYNYILAISINTFYYTVALNSGSEARYICYQGYSLRIQLLYLSFFAN